MILHNIGHSVKKMSRIRSRTVKGVVSVSSRLLGVSVSVSSRRNFPMSRSRLGLGHEGLVSIPGHYSSFRLRLGFGLGFNYLLLLAVLAHGIVLLAVSLPCAFASTEYSVSK